MRIIIIIVFRLTALPNQNKVYPRSAKKASSIQNGYRESETYARVLYTTKDNKKKQAKIKMDSKVGTKKKEVPKV